MAEKILSIVYDDHISNDGVDGSYASYFEGYVITTDKQQIKVMVSGGQCCCEDYGSLASEDDLSDYIGATLIKASVTGTDRVKSDVEFEYGFGEGDIMFVDFETSNGVFQIAVYNHHNGYYGHDGVFMTATQQVKVNL